MILIDFKTFPRSLIYLDDVKKEGSDIIHIKKQNEDVLDNGLIVEDAQIDLNNIHETVEVKCDSVNECDSNNEDFTIDPDQIQIKADAEELNRRIQCFIARKREQVNMVNAQEFCSYRLVSSNQKNFK